MDLKLRVAICDDEKYFREEIKRLVEQYLKEKKIIFCIDLFTSGLEFCSDDNNLQQYDIIFLDIGNSVCDTGKKSECGHCFYYYYDGLCT